MYLRKPLEFIYRKKKESSLNISFGWIFVIIAIWSLVAYLLLSNGLVSDLVVTLLFIPVVPVFIFYIVQGSIDKVVESNFSSSEWISTYFPAFSSSASSEWVSKLLDGIYYGLLYFYIYLFVLASVIMPVQMVIYVVQNS